jgi:hypothetical protein
MTKIWLIKLCGLGSIVGGILEILVRVPQFTYFNDQPLTMMAKQPGFVLLLGMPSLVASILILFVVIGVYMVQMKESGTFGLFAFLIAFVGVILSTGANWTYAFVSPAIAQSAPHLLEGDPAGQGLVTAIMTSYLAAQMGLLVLGISMLRAKVFPRWVSYTLICSIIIVGILSPFAGTQFLRFLYNGVIGLGPIVVGWYLFTKHTALAKD